MCEPSFRRLLSCLEQIRSKLDSRQEDFMFLSNYFHSQEFQMLFKVHSTVSYKDQHKTKAVNTSAVDVNHEVVEAVKCVSETDQDVSELKEILCSAHIKGLLQAHDRVAARDFSAKEVEDAICRKQLPNVHEWDDEIRGDPVKIVRLIKSGNDPLGATVKCDEETGNIVVARILHGGVVDRSGTLQVGDVILEINNQSVKGKTTNEVVEIMGKLSGSVMFKVIPVMGNKISQDESKIRQRALFDYEPAGDDLIPCKEAGLPFIKGDILYVVSREDSNWWQAKKEEEMSGKIGLIPSKKFQEKRLLFDKLFAETEKQKPKNGTVKPIKNFGLRIKKKKESKLLDARNDESDGDVEKALTYEEVVLYSPSDNKQRLMLIIGPPGVGRNELKKRLLASDNERFVTAVPHTSRCMRPYETDGREYYFVSRTTMENYEQNDKFIELGEFRKCLYGTSIDSIKRALKTGKICVLKVQTAGIKTLRRKEYKPYLIYIKPPTLEKLRSTRVTVKSKSDKKKGMKSFKDDDLQEMIKAGEAIEKEYGHMFDITIVNEDLQEAYYQLSNVIEKVVSDAMWVPVEWVQ